MKINLKSAFDALQLSHEICYNSKKDSKDILQLLDFSVHRSSASRGNCRFTRGYMNGYIVHTHPFGSKAYPSSEDIIHVIKHPNIKVSLIVSTIGVWELSFNGDDYISMEDTIFLQEKINNIISAPLYNLGLQRGLDRSKPQDISLSLLKKKINQYIKKIINIFKKKNIRGLKINFTNIRNIPENKIYTINNEKLNNSSIKSLKKSKKKTSIRRKSNKKRKRKSKR